MKFFKLIKSIDYVAYPSYKELRKISDSITDSVSTFKEIILSSIIGLLFDRLYFSKTIIGFLKGSNINFIKQFASQKGMDVLIATIFALLIYALLIIRKKIKKKISSNKDSISKRNLLIDDFFHIIIPGQIEAKSIVEQIDENKNKDTNTKILLILQAIHQIEYLQEELREMNLFEIDSDGKQSKESKILLDKIGLLTYTELLKGMEVCLMDIWNILNEEEFSEYRVLIEKVNRIIVSTLFEEVPLDEKHKKLRDTISMSINS